MHSLPEAQYDTANYRNGGLHLSPVGPLMTSSLPRPYHTLDTLQCSLKHTDSDSTLDESGISSKGSSMLDDTGSPVTWSTSAPSTPNLIARKKPPPKPPRVKSYIENNDLSLSSTPSVKSGKAETLQPDALADVTSTLDASVARGSADGSLVMKQQNPLLMKDKVFQVLVQTRDFLFYEINPENILGYLSHKGVINLQTEQELRKCHSRQAMCEMLLDIITSKGQREFTVFCDSLRKVEKQDYLADLMIVLDRLIETVTSTMARRSIRRSRSSQTSVTSQESLSEDNISNSMCNICRWDNNNDSEEVLNDCSSFDIDISYYDKETGHMSSIKDVATIKKRSRQISVEEKDSSFLAKQDIENAKRYVPVISLSLYNQCLYQSGIETLAKILEQHVCIRELSLAKNHIGTSAMRRLGKALQKNKGLIKLDIRLNTIGEEGAFHLANGLQHCTSLRTLNVTGTELSGTGYDVILASLSNGPSLTDLDLGFNDLKDRGCKGLAELVSTSSNLRKLRIRDNNVTHRGAGVLFKALKKNSRLCELNISSNDIGDESMSILSEVLLHNRYLREINLEKCCISKVGCLALARALKTNRTVKFLDLSMNPVKDDGVEALSDGLKYNQVLGVLCLNMCSVGNTGFLRLLEALRYNTNMTIVKMCYNLIGPNESHDTSTDQSTVPSIDELYEMLCQVLRFNKNLKILLWGNTFDEPCDSPPEHHLRKETTVSFQMENGHHT